MTDVHIHIERGPYTREWISRFADQAVKAGLDEIWLLEHSFRFREFAPIIAGLRFPGKSRGLGECGGV